MADEQKNFEPYLDWDSIEDEMVDDLHELFMEFRKAKKNFISSKSKERAVAVLKAQYELGRITTAIHHAIFTRPMMIHVAGPKQKIADEDGSDQIVQRCKRCGSILQLWSENFMAVTPAGPIPLEEEDVPWWDDDDVVAKAGDPDQGMQMYEVGKDRELERHERLCPDLTSLAGDLTG